MIRKKAVRTSAKKTAGTATKKVAKSAQRKTPRAEEASNRGLGDWRASTLQHMRELILEADPQMVEERKWKKPSNPAGVPVWSHDGIVCTGETYKNVVKLTFAQGASLPDPAGLFNASLEAGTRRAIDIPEGEEVDARAFKALIKVAVIRNGTSADRKKT